MNAEYDEIIRRLILVKKQSDLEEINIGVGILKDDDYIRYVFIPNLEAHGLKIELCEGEIIENMENDSYANKD